MTSISAARSWVGFARSVLGLAAVVVMVDASSRSARASDAHVSASMQHPQDAALTADPAELDFGRIVVGATVTRTIRIHNAGETPSRLVSAGVDAEWVTIAWPREHIVEPGDAIEVQFAAAWSVDDGPQAAVASFVFTGDQPPLALELSAFHMPAITAVLEQIILSSRDDGAGEDPGPGRPRAIGRITLGSTDAVPFRIRNTFPPNVVAIPSVAASTHVFEVPWGDVLRVASRHRRVLFRIDHPACSRASVSLPVHHTNRPGAPLGTASSRAILHEFTIRLADGRQDEALALVASGRVMPELVDHRGQGPLLIASLYGSVRVMQALFDDGADIDATDPSGRSALTAAAARGHLPAVLWLLEQGCTVDQIDSGRATPLVWAASSGWSEIVRALLDAGAAADGAASSPSGLSPLFLAAERAGDHELVRLLIEAGANIERRVMIGRATILMHAARANHHDIVVLLIESGARLDVTDRDGNGPLAFAAAWGDADPRMIELLLEFGVDPEATNAAGETALDLALRRTDRIGRSLVPVLREAMEGE